MGDTMIHNETVTPAKSVAEQVVKMCLISAMAIGALIVILRLIRGENFFHAVSVIFPAISVLALFYWMILSQRRQSKR
jgi:membrane-associated PAP2 superfamily phosphatase